jgi:integrase
MSCIFESAFAPYIKGLIEQKHADGCIYTDGEMKLKRFDAFCKENFPQADRITHELATEWSSIRASESSAFRDCRVAALRQLSLYMLSLGIDAYVPRNYSKRYKPVLYIPTREEMIAFFKEMGAWAVRLPKHQRFVDECKMMFLLYYCCGMRLSEARFLKKEHVDFDKGILTIFASKGHKDRLVYLPQDGMEVILGYSRRIEAIVPASPWMFPGENPSKPISHTCVETHFKRCWVRLPFSANTNKYPTPHCLRHAFVVERLNDWMLRDVETRHMLAYLSKYLGHKSPSETFYYYHIVKKAFSIIREKDRVSQRVITEVIPHED